MAEYDSEELESLKRWWANNGASLVVGVLVGVLVIGGWQAWRWYSDRQATAAADTYARLRHGVDTGKVTPAVVDVAAKLKDDHAGSPYAGAAALKLAAYYVDQQQYAKAIAQLDWAMDNAGSVGVRQIATVRKARLLWTQGKAKAALALLDNDHPASFDALYAELAGDIHADQGQRKAAYTAYKRALANLPADTPRRPIERKLAHYAPADAATAASERARQTPAAS